MLEWVALNVSTTACSTLTCSGASPAPRQQNQRIRVTPGATDAGPAPNGVGAGVAVGAGDWAAAGSAVASNSAAVAPTRAARRWPVVRALPDDVCHSWVMDHLLL